MSKKGIVKIHGKEYKTVALRVNEFHANRSDTMRINTELVYHDDKRVVMKALIYDSDVLVATGYAEENRAQGNINKTSAMENAETGAIGRALACYGLGGDEYASADEVLRAISQQRDLEGHEPSPGEVTQEELSDGADTTTESSDIATKPTKSETTTEDSEQWTSDIPDDILDVVAENISIIRKYTSDKEAKEWHAKALSNFLMINKNEVAEKGVMETIKGLEREQLAELAEYQNDKIKINKED